jgi:hypothetical protein
MGRFGEFNNTSVAVSLTGIPLECIYAMQRTSLNHGFAMYTSIPVLGIIPTANMPEAAWAMLRVPPGTL